MDIKTIALRKQEERFFTKYGVCVRYFNNCKTITDTNKILYHIEKYIANEPFATSFFFSYVFVYSINKNLFELQQKLTAIMSKDSLESALNILARSDTLSNLKKFIKEHELDLKTNKNIFLEAIEGQSEFWEYLISKNLNVSINNNSAFIRSIYYNDEIRSLSLFYHKNFDIKVNTNNMFYAICRSGNISILKTFIEKSNIKPEIERNKGLYLAVENGQLEISKFLLQFENVNRKTNLYNNRILKMAFKNIKKSSFYSEKYNNIVELLLKESNLNHKNIDQENIKRLSNTNKKLLNNIFINNKLKAF